MSYKIIRSSTRKYSIGSVDHTVHFCPAWHPSKLKCITSSIKVIMSWIETDKLRIENLNHVSRFYHIDCEAIFRRIERDLCTIKEITKL